VRDAKVKTKEEEAAEEQAMREAFLSRMKAEVDALLVADNSSQPLSLEDKLRTLKDSHKEQKPVFLSKEERQRLALAKQEAERAERLKREQEEREALRRVVDREKQGTSEGGG
jgi:tRNA nucleotidyltransferase/poly(A) polymerase